MFTLGLTGGIASGKSAVAAEFAKLGATLVDADVIARQIVEPGCAAFDKIVAHFGADILSAESTLNRAKLRQIIFNEPCEKRWLEQLLHPRIDAEIKRQQHAATGCYSILVSPLLFESAQNVYVDRTLTIDVPVAIQIERAVLRDNNSAALITAIINNQMPRAARVARADDVLDNSGAFAATLQHIYTLHNTYLKLAHDC